MTRGWLLPIIVVVIAMDLAIAAFILLSWRSTPTSTPASSAFQKASTGASASGATAVKGARLDFLSPHAIGDPVVADQRPLIAHVSVADLDADGLADILVADVAKNRVTWIRQSPRGTFTEIDCATNVQAPAHVAAVDIDRDGDLDLLVASLGVLYPNNAKIGAVVALENDGHERFTTRVLADRIARVSDVRAGDLDGDGDLDLAVAQFGYDDGETRWMENKGGWQFESHNLQNLSGPINAEIADIDGDGDRDIVSLVSQEWEEVYAFVNDGRGRFMPTLIYGASNEDFGSSWITVVDLDRDGDVDVLYSNGDAFDYAPPKGRVWNGIQWLENAGGVTFTYHRLADLPGASSPQAADLDADGDLDIIVVSAYNDWSRPDAQSLIWLQNDGKMHFTVRDIASTPTHLITLAAGDVDGDGRPDLVTGGMHFSPPFDRQSRVTLWMNGWQPGR